MHNLDLAAQIVLKSIQIFSRDFDVVELILQLHVEVWQEVVDVDHNAVAVLGNAIHAQNRALFVVLWDAKVIFRVVRCET